MKIKVDQPLKTLEGMSGEAEGEDGGLRDKSCPRCSGTGNLRPGDPEFDTASNKAVTLRRLSVNALLTGEENLSGEQKLERGELAKKIFMAPKDSELDLESKEIQLIKKQIGKCYNSLVVMQAWPLLEGKSE